MTSAENLIERSTRTVTDFARNGQWFENTETHARISGGYISFDCGHGYTWNAWGGKPAPRPGTRDLCAQCIEAALAEFTAAQS